MSPIEEMIEQIEKDGKHFRGRQELLKYLKGKKLTMKQSIHAHCYDCQGYYDGGSGDCESRGCPLRPYMPYSSIKYASKPMSEQSRKALLKAREEKRKIEG